MLNVLRKNYRTLELAHWVAEIIEQHRGVSVQVKRDRSVESGARSYYVIGDKIERELGFRAERGTTKAVLEIWDGLERGAFGAQPEENPSSSTSAGSRNAALLAPSPPGSTFPRV